MGNNTSDTAVKGQENDVDSFLDCVQNGNEAKVTEYLSSGVVLNIPGSKGYSALLYAILSNQIHIADMLLDYDGIEVNFKSLHEGKNGVMVCAEIGSIHILKKLMDRKAKVNEADTGSQWTALHFAAYGNHVEALQILLNGGADVDAVDCSNQTALHIASVRGHCASARCLLQSGADYLLLDNEGNDAFTLAEDPEMSDLILSYVNHTSGSIGDVHAPNVSDVGLVESVV